MSFWVSIAAVFQRRRVLSNGAGGPRRSLRWRRWLDPPRRRSPSCSTRSRLRRDDVHAALEPPADGARGARAARAPTTPGSPSSRSATAPARPGRRRRAGLDVRRVAGGARAPRDAYGPVRAYLERCVAVDGRDVVRASPSRPPRRRRLGRGASTASSGSPTRSRARATHAWRRASPTSPRCTSRSARAAAARRSPTTPSSPSATWPTSTRARGDAAASGNIGQRMRAVARAPGVRRRHRLARRSTRPRRDG